MERQTERVRIRIKVSLTVEDIFCVAGPDLVLCVLVDERGCHGRVAGDHLEAALGQHVERPLQVLELEVKPGRVPIRGPVRVPALVQGLPENFFGEGHPPADQYPRYPPELGVGLTLPAHGARPPVPHRDEAALPVRGDEGGRRALPVVAPLGAVFIVAVEVVVRAVLEIVGGQELHQVGQLEVLRLFPEPPFLGEVVREDDLLVSEVVQHVPE